MALTIKGKRYTTFGAINVTNGLAVGGTQKINATGDFTVATGPTGPTGADFPTGATTGDFLKWTGTTVAWGTAGQYA